MLKPNFNKLLDFHELGLHDKLLNVVHDLGYKLPTPIQRDSIPLILQGRDLLGQAQTGTGKTAAFALPLLNNLMHDINANYNQAKLNLPKILILTPTRELAIQVNKSFEIFSKNIDNVHTISIYGGKDYTYQIRALKKGVDIVVGTVGRIMDHLRRGNLKLTGLRTLVLDEADEMLKMGFVDDVIWILSRIHDNCQRLLFSATIPRGIFTIVNKYLRNYVKVYVESKLSTNTIDQNFIIVRGFSKIDALDRILEFEKTKGAIIFVKTKSSTINIANFLRDRGYSAVSMNGDIQQNQREQIISQLKNTKFDILVATDVAARGLDIDHITHVINYDLPQDNDSYIHRIGRTGRAGRQGKAISLIYTKEIRQLRLLEKAIRNRITELNLPNALDITKKRLEDFRKKIVNIIECHDLSKFNQVCQKFLTEFNIKQNDLLGALMFLAQEKRNLFVSEYKQNTKIHVNDHKMIKNGNDKISKKNFASKRNYHKSKSSMITYRVEVGKIDGVEPRNLVGAIANETNIKSRSIGQICLFDKFSTVDFPSEISKIEIERLKTVWVLGKKLQIKIIKKSSVF